MSLKPLEDRIIVQADKKEDKKTEFGLIIAGTADEKPNEATVVAVGPGITLDNGDKIIPDVKVGDRIVFAKYQGTEVSHDGQDYIILAYRDVLAVIG